jgi:hypothetical protein
MRGLLFLAVVSALGALTALLAFGDVSRQVGGGTVSRPEPAPAPAVPAPAPPARPPEDLKQFLARYGPPPEDRTTEKDVPRPRFVSRILTYRAERVRATYLTDAPFGTPPAYRRWKLAGYTDPVLNEPIDPEEADRRLSAGGRGGPP